MLGIWLFAMRYAPCSMLFRALAGFHTDATDIMAEMEGFGKGLQLFVASEMIEILRSLFNGFRWADFYACPAGTAVSCERRAGLKREIGEEGEEANPGTKRFIDEEIIPADPTQPRGTGQMLV